MAVTFDLVHQQWIRKLIVLGAIVTAFLLAAFSRAISPEDSIMHEAVERSGIILILIAIVGRVWCSLYIGGRKLQTLVRKGPYSISRNPLYVFSAVAAFGVGAQLGSLTLAILAGAATLLIFYFVVRQEEQALTAHFSAEFAHYRARVPRFLPNLFLWREAETLTVHPALVRQTFLDACVFLLAAPAVKTIGYLQDGGYIVPFFNFY